MFSLLRKVYHWFLAQGEKRSAPLFLFFLAVTEAIFIPIPVEALLVPLCLSLPFRSFYFSFLATSGSVLGAVMGYLLGKVAMDSVGNLILNFLHLTTYWERAEDLFHRYDTFVIFFSAFTPIPYKVFTLLAGAMGMEIAPFVLFSILGRGLRFFMVGGFFFWFGENARIFIERYFEWVTIGLSFLLLLLYYLATRL